MYLFIYNFLAQIIVIFFRKVSKYLRTMRDTILMDAAT